MLKDKAILTRDQISKCIEQVLSQHDRYAMFKANVSSVIAIQVHNNYLVVKIKIFYLCIQYFYIIIYIIIYIYTIYLSFFRAYSIFSFKTNF